MCVSSGLYPTVELSPTTLDVARGLRRNACARNLDDCFCGDARHLRITHQLIFATALIVFLLPV